MYGFDVAKSSLQTMGITHNVVDEGLLSRDRSRAASPLVAASPHPTKDPLWLIDAAEVGRLCRTYEEEIGIMYPVVDIDRVQKHAKRLYKFIGASLRSGFGQPNLPGADAFDDEDTVVLKMILAITLIVEGSGRSELGERFFESAKPAVDLKLVMNTGTLSVVLLVLTATYYFQKDEETQAWRFIGIAARICIEMGLHRRDSLIRTFTNEAEYQQAVRVFWVVYALDRRWSFGTGMPFALQDADIDPSLPEPVGCRRRLLTPSANTILGRCLSISQAYHQIQSNSYEGLVSQHCLRKRPKHEERRNWVPRLSDCAMVPGSSRVSAIQRPRSQT